MRNQWRLLLQRCKPVSELQFKVQSSTTVPLYHNRTFHSVNPHSPALHIHFQNRSFPRLFTSSSELAVEQNKATDQSAITSTLIELYSDPIKSNEDVMLELRSKPDLTSTGDVTKLFENRGSEPKAAKAFYDWVMSKESDNLSSNSCNRLLGMLGANGLVKEFWDSVDFMKKKGYGVKKGASVRAMAKFEEEGLKDEVQKLKDLFALGSIDASIEKLSSKVSKIIQQTPWGDDVETKLQELGAVYSPDLVKMVLENLGSDPNKAVIFFRWIQESGLYKHDETTYNAIAKELAREDYIDKFWRVIDEMRTSGYDMNKSTYIQILNKFVRKKMLKDAVDLYEFSMNGNIKPSIQDCTFLLRKIVTSHELDMDLVSKVLKVYKQSGNKLTDAMSDSVLKSLTSVNRFGDCNKILKSMEEVGFTPGENIQSKIAFKLSKNSKSEEVGSFLESMEASGSYKTFGSLIEGYCLSGEIDKARDCFLKQTGPTLSGYALETITNAYCSNKKPLEGYKLVIEVVNEVKPWHTTYKLLTTKLIEQGFFKESVGLLAHMKRHGYPPYLDPFVKYVATSGTIDDTLVFLKGMTVKKVPSINVYLRVFKAYFKAGRGSEAQDFLAKCPRFIRNHVDVLNMFSEVKRGKDDSTPTPLAV
ncbi:hypothetical protein LXL04_006443 [Taraxacum kok-saghyz]